MKLITVVICTYNRSKYLNLCLQSLVNQTLNLEFFNVIVIDNNSKDDTKKIVNQFLKKLPLKYIFEKEQGLSHARNKGIKESFTEYISYIDDDAKADKNWLKIAHQIIQEKKHDIFGGPIYPYYESKKPKWFLDRYEIREVSKKPKYLKQNEFISGSNIFFRKKIFDKIGLFDTKLGMKGDKISVGEETKLQIIAGKKGIVKYYDPKLFVYHLVPKKKMTIKYLIKRSFVSYVFKESIFDKYEPKFIIDLRKFLPIFVYLFKYPFRDKNKYRYWQNYFIELILKKMGLIAKLYAYIWFKK